MRSSPSRPADPLAPGPAGFAHRGRHGPYPLVENSLTAFAASLEMGAGIECDVRLTTDGQVVVFHDRDTMRLTGTAGIVERTTLADLQALPLADQPIPTLAQLLALIDGQAPMLIEVKCEGHRAAWCRALASLVRDYRGRFGIMSFDPILMGWVRVKLPWIRRGLVVRDGLDRIRRGLALHYAQPAFVAVERHAVAKRWVQDLRRRIPVYCWTVRTAAERQCLEPFADALIWEADGRP